MKLSILHKSVRLLSIALPIGVVLFLAAVTVYFFSHSYASFIQAVLASIQRPDLETVIRTHYFSLEKFNRMRWCLVISVVISTAILFVLYRYKKEYDYLIDRIIRSVNNYLNSIQRIVLSFSKTGRIALVLLLFILLCRSIYMATIFYIQYDEAWNYNLFLDKQLFYSIGAYNNYPLHNIVSWCLVHVLGSSVLVLRLTSILSGLCCTFVVALCVQHFVKNEKLALLAAALFCCLPVSLFYMLYARGVLLEMAVALLVSSLILHYSNLGFTLKRVLLVSVLNAFGTYSMLSHPYFIVSSFAALLLYSLLYEQKNWLLVLAYGFFSLLFSVTLLIPMMLGTGLSPVIAVLTRHQAIQLNDIISYVERVSFFITGFSHSFYFLFVLSSSLLVYFFRKNNLLCLLSLFNCSLLLLPVFIPLLTNVYPPERAISFLVLVPLNSAVLFFYSIHIMKAVRFMLYPLALSCLLVLSYASYTHPFLNWSRVLDKQVMDVAMLLKQNHITRVYNDSREFDYFIPGIEFYCKQHHKSIEFSSSSISSTRYASTIDATIQCVVLSKQSTAAYYQGDSLLYESGDIMIYKRTKK
jgi:hypothetical protein